MRHAKESPAAAAACMPCTRRRKPSGAVGLLHAPCDAVVGVLGVDAGEHIDTGALEHNVGEKVGLVTVQRRQQAHCLRAKASGRREWAALHAVLCAFDRRRTSDGGRCGRDR
jgi:hypothetical protein